MVTKNNLLQLNQLVTKYQKELYQWFRRILLMASTLFGILVALYKPGKHNYSEYFFAAGLCALGLGILAGAIVLGLSVHISKRKVRAYKELILNTDTEFESSAIKVGNASKIFAIARVFSYISLSLSILCLIAYILSDIF